MLNTKVVTWSLASFAAVTYLVCILYGLVEAFLYGAYTGVVFAPLHNTFHKRWVAS
ncbi:MAG: hypothetical protein OEO79_03305 [Gemmatimonadota bacterium]|nr:hypothetical protein [Gemmatimonadota bacterium]MDH3423594.1 hypothetical protein [Gemmatimonadota bacterium]